LTFGIVFDRAPFRILEAPARIFWFGMHLGHICHPGDANLKTANTNEFGLAEPGQKDWWTRTSEQNYSESNSHSPLPISYHSHTQLALRWLHGCKAHHTEELQLDECALLNNRDECSCGAVNVKTTNMNEFGLGKPGQKNPRQTPDLNTELQ